MYVFEQLEAPSTTTPQVVGMPEQAENLVVAKGAPAAGEGVREPVPRKDRMSLTPLGKRIPHGLTRTPLGNRTNLEEGLAPTTEGVTPVATQPRKPQPTPCTPQLGSSVPTAEAGTAATSAGSRKRRHSSLGGGQENALVTLETPAATMCTRPTETPAGWPKFTLWEGTPQQPEPTTSAEVSASVDTTHNPRRTAAAAAATCSTTEVPEPQWQTLLTSLYPPKRSKRPRRWLSTDQKTHRCNIDGCTKSYGSASSLCAHKRAHHPGWKERRREEKNDSPRDLAAEALEKETAAKERKAAAAREAAEAAAEDAEDDYGDDDDDTKTPRLNSAHVATLTPELRLTPTGQWLELLAADAHGRLGAFRRSRQRVQKTYKDEQDAYTTAHAATTPGSSSAEFAGAAGVTAALRLLREMDLTLEREILDVEAWLAHIDQMGSAVAAGLLESAPGSVAQEVCQERLNAVLSGTNGGPPMTREKLEAAKDCAIASVTTIASMALSAAHTRDAARAAAAGPARTAA